MKRAACVCVGVLVLSLSLSGCFTIMMLIPKDHGIYNPNNVPETELVNLSIFWTATVTQIGDDTSVNWGGGFGSRVNSTVKIPPGLYTLKARFSDGQRYTEGSLDVRAFFEAGKSYLLRPQVEGYLVSMHIYRYDNNVEGEEVKFNIQALLSGGSGVLDYVKNVMDPLSEGSNKTVRLENDDILIVYTPGNHFSLTDKSAGTTVSGYNGFSMQLQNGTAKVFLYETDTAKMTFEEFLKTDYETSSQTILLVSGVTDKTVVYIYDAPAAQKGEKITLNYALNTTLN
jgi:hypothetical protein